MSGNIITHSLTTTAELYSTDEESVAVFLLEARYICCFTSVRNFLSDGDVAIPDVSFDAMDFGDHTGHNKSAILKYLDDPAKVDALVNCWLRTFKVWLDTLPSGSAIVFDLRTGRFVAAATRLAALDAFGARYGQHEAVGWLHEVGGKFVLGGGLA